MQEESTPDESRGSGVTLRWIVPDGLQARCATHLFVQQNGHEFTLYFFEAKPPLIAGTPDKTRAELERIGTVPAECVAKIMVSATRMPEFLELLALQLQHHSEIQSGGPR